MARAAAYQTRYHNKAAIYIMLITLGIFAAVLFVNCRTLTEKKSKLQAEQTEKQRLLAEQQQWALELQELEKETQTKGFIIQTARERLNLGFEDEIYFKSNND